MSLSTRIIIYGFGTLVVIGIWIFDRLYGPEDEPVLQSIRLRLKSIRQVPRVIFLPVVVVSVFNLVWWSTISSLPSLSVPIKIILYTGFLVCFLAPIFEEFFLRGGLIGVVKSYFNLSNSYLPLLVLFSSIFFITGHLSQPVSPAYFFITSVIYSTLYIYNDYNILSVIVAHGTSNLFTLLWRILI